MKVCALVDFIGTSTQTPEEEYAEIKLHLCELLKVDPQNMQFETDVYPPQLTNKSPDMYVIDFGGLMPGCEDGIRSHFRELLTQIEEHPNTLFVIWSRFTQRWYEDAINNFSPDFNAPNVDIWTGNNAGIVKWFGVKAGEEMSAGDRES